MHQNILKICGGWASPGPTSELTVLLTH